MEERVKRIMSQVLGVPAASITTETSQQTISRWDSLGHMNLCLALEEEFGVAFDDRQVVDMTSYGAIVAALEKLGPR